MMETGIRNEPLEPLSLVARRALPGAPPSLSTVYRWVRQGLRGVPLRTVRIGSRRLVRASEFQAWLERVAESYDRPSAALEDQDREERAARARERLKELGC